jgi:rhodanese-related sulfurtransferase
MAIRSISKATLQTWLSETGLGQGRELAVLDLRSVEAFAKGHPLFATNVPLATLERNAEHFVPRKSVTLVLVDESETTEKEGAQILAALGYTDIAVLAGGLAAWLADGRNGQPTFDIPGIIFSESVRDAESTPSIDAVELDRLYAIGSDVIVLDTRTPEEFAQFHVPGARNLPGAEILHRFKDFVPSEKTFVVVSCAGLPRAILGAQTLIDGGVPNRVALLEDGTSGWTRAGFKLESGAEPAPGPASKAAIEAGRSYARGLVTRGNLQYIDRAGTAAWLAESDGRTTYVLDVRATTDYAQSHVPGSISSPGGQLHAVSHRTVATRGARLVLVDDHETRAVTSAYWLARRGWEVRVLRDPFGTAAAATAREPALA